jgi:hypothetical protein
VMERTRSLRLAAAMMGPVDDAAPVPDRRSSERTSDP